MVHRPNPVQSISQQRQQFSSRAIQPQQADASEELAMEIYARLVAGRHLDQRYTQPDDEEKLRQLAEHARLAASAFFSAE